MSKRAITHRIGLALLLVAGPAAAHKAWILPSATVATPGEWITVDAAVSNDLFYFNHRPLALDNLVVTGPDGRSLTPQSTHSGHFRSVFDLPLKQAGSYRLALVNEGLFASWTEGEESKRWRGTAEDFAAQVPKNAAELSVVQVISRNETFVTAGAPSSTALAPNGRGIELKPITHPNDLYAGETAHFVLLVDGEPAANQALTVTPGGTRYRDSQNEIAVRTDGLGEFAIRWKEPGLYWLNASWQDDRASIAPATQRRLSYSATLEVLLP